MRSNDFHMVRSLSKEFSHSGSLPGVVNAVDDSVEIQNSLLATVVRKRWWLLILCCLVSGSLAYVIATTYGKITATSQGNLVYNGLLDPPGPKVYDAPRLKTFSQLLLSMPTMKKLLDKHGLGILPAKLRERFACQVTRDSDIMTLELRWGDPEDAIEMVNDAMELLIDEAAERRRTLLRERMKQVELSLLETKSELANVTDRLRRMKQQRSAQDFSGGQAGDRYTSQLAQVTTTQTAIDSKTAEKRGIEMQLVHLEESARKYQDQMRKRLYEERMNALRILVKQYKYKKGSDKMNRVEKVYRELEDHMQSSDETASFDEWRAGFEAIGTDLLASLQVGPTPDRQRLEGQLATVQTTQHALRLDLISVVNHLKLLQTWIADYEKAVEASEVKMTEVSADEISEQEKKVELTEGRYQLSRDQLDNMRKMEQYKTREFSISMPASLETTVVSSNKKKLFVLVFFGCGMVLALPVFLAEWLRQRDSPVQRVANQFGLPLIADRLIKDYAPSDRVNKLDWRSDESLRMLTLRIQQSSQGPASVILFSGLRLSTLTLPLLSAVAECLAEREERVLLIDAIDPSLTLLSQINSRLKLLPGEMEKRDAIDASVDASVPGLTEFLSRECEGVMDLIRPTKCPGVDWIWSGNSPFPAEALASSCVTELLDHCRKTYTMLLVAGPPVSAQADLQMLAARADGVVLTTDKKSAADPACLLAVQDLIDLGVPIIGVVG